MYKKLSLSALLVLVLAGLFATGFRAFEAQAAEREAAEAARAAESFYRWHLGYPGNAFAEKAYRQSPLVTDAFVVEMDAAIEAMHAAGPASADLILCAQDIPGDMRYGFATVSGNRASATVQEVWNPGTEFEQIRDVEVLLEQVDGQWLIDQIVCP